MLSLKALPNMSRMNEAQSILERIATTVAPVMSRRKWKVNVLEEFFPKEDGLLGMNVNRGQIISVRLRPANNPNEFYSWEHIIGTTIHELTHIKVGPHNSEFFRLMDELADEVGRDEDNLNFTKRFAGNMFRFGVPVTPVAPIPTPVSVPTRSSISRPTLIKNPNLKPNPSISTSANSGHLGGVNRLSQSSRKDKADAVAKVVLARLARNQLSGSGTLLTNEKKPTSKEELRRLVTESAERRNALKLT